MDRSDLDLRGDRRDTIAAIATPPGAGGVGIVRLSGPAAAGIVARLLGREEGAFEDRRMTHGWARDPAAGERLDEVLAVVMRGPRSYTGEDVAEIHAHGGAVNLGRILRAAVACGARVAEPGEFTRRAFESGRIDLTAAEAVAGVIGAASERALRAAQEVLGGALGRRVDALRRQLVALLAEVEASIDFPEEDLDFPPAAAIAAGARGVAAGARELAATYAVGRALRDGIEVAIVGAPNVGKSSLLNALAGEERALVAEEPGTTRDWVEARVVWHGVPVVLIDTAGEREVDGLEGRGVALGRARATRADVVVRVRDVSRVSDAHDMSPPTPATAGGAQRDARDIEVWNKVDLASAPEGVLGVSALTGHGLGRLRDAVLGRALGGAAVTGVEVSEGHAFGVEAEGLLVSTERQRALLEGAAAAAENAAGAAEAGRPAEVVAVDLREAAAQLGRITGDEVGADVLDALFARFCIGK